MTPRKSWCPLGAECLRAALLGMPLLDEVLSGFMVISLPLLRADLGLSYAQAGLLMTAGHAASMLLGPIISLASDRRSKRLPVLAGILGTAAGFALIAGARGFAGLLLAFLIISPANSIALGLGQASLIDQAPHAAPRTMTRWAGMGAVGDLLSPLALAAWIAHGQGWRPLFWLSAGFWLAFGLALSPLPFPRSSAGAEADGDSPNRGPEVSRLAALKSAARQPLLLRWMAVLLVTDLLDESFVGFATLYLTDAMHVSPAAASLAMSAQMAGSVLGLLLLDRLLGRYRGERLLPALALLALTGLLLLLNASSIGWAAAALFLTGLGAAGWYPIAKAAAYGVLPGRTGTVLAVMALSGPFGAALPAAIGGAASRWGIRAAIILTALAPLGVLLLAPRDHHPRAGDVTTNEPAN